MKKSVGLFVAAWFFGPSLFVLLALYALVAKLKDLHIPNRSINYLRDLRHAI